jgi:NAD(P)-dependent dehydrogenase (short-subunit alcohol dehydrogenase family)
VSRNCPARPSSSSAAARASGWRQPAGPAPKGAEVILAARRPDRLRQAAAEVGADGTAAFDATDPAALERFFAGLPAPIDHVMVTGPGRTTRPWPSWTASGRTAPSTITSG